MKKDRQWAYGEASTLMSVTPVRKASNNSFVPLWRGCANALRACVDLLVEFQVKDEGCAKGLHQEAALGQMDGLREGWELGEGGIR